MVRDGLSKEVMYKVKCEMASASKKCKEGPRQREQYAKALGADEYLTSSWNYQKTEK